MRCVVLSEHLPKLHIPLYTPVWIVPYRVFTNHLKECVLPPWPFRPKGCCDCLCLSRLSRLSVRPSVLSACLPARPSICQGSPKWGELEGVGWGGLVGVGGCVGMGVGGNSNGQHNIQSCWHGKHQRTTVPSCFYFQREAKAPTQTEVQRNMQHDICNEINAVATLVAEVIPLYYPQLKYREDGCILIPMENSYMVVSGDGSEIDDADENIVAFELKCPVRKKPHTPDVYYTFPVRYTTQVLSQMALNMWSVL